MTLRTNARVAGFAFLLYIAAALPAMILETRIVKGESIAEKLANIAQHPSLLRLAFVLALVGCFCALVLAVTLYAITRVQDPDLAMLGLTCRVAEGVIGAVAIPTLLQKAWLATAAGADAPDPGTAKALGAVLLKLPESSGSMAATFFALGSTVFAYLLLRGRMIPVALAWLGVFASVLVVVGVPLQLIGALGSPITELMWMPMLAFEVVLAVWLIVKGVSAPPRLHPA